MRHSSVPLVQRHHPPRAAPRARGTPREAEWTDVEVGSAEPEPEREDAAIPAQTDDPVCAACGRPLYWAGPPAEENGVPICAECDAANNFDVDE